jgi:hypothetical protein
VGQIEEEETLSDTLTVSRRWLLLTVGAFFNAVVGVAVTVPVVKYLLSPVKSDDAYKSWISLGAADSFADWRDTFGEVYQPSELGMGR